MLQLDVERCGSFSPVFTYVLTIISVKILHKCDENSLTSHASLLVSRLSEKLPLMVHW